MCGRYILRQAEAAEHYFRVHGTPWQASFNIPPTVDVAVIRELEGARVGLNMRWGLVPFFAKGVAGKYSTHNARIETFQTNASYRGPWKRGQRCLQAASGFYEWQLASDGKKQPYFIRVADRDTYAFAGLWDRSASDDGLTVIESVTHVTMPAPPGTQVHRIHNTGSHPHRMPAILRQEDEDVWLHGTPEQAFAVLQPYPDDLIVSYPVPSRVGNVRQNDERLIEPIPSAAAPPAPGASTG
jgi:putative SOS response-associated peptidase YedK